MLHEGERKIPIIMSHNCHNHGVLSTRLPAEVLNSNPIMCKQGEERKERERGRGGSGEQKNRERGMKPAMLIQGLQGFHLCILVVYAMQGPQQRQSGLNRAENDI